MSNVVMELVAKLGIDSKGFEDGMGKAKAMAGNVGGAIGKGLKVAVGVGVAAVGAASAAVTALGVEAVKTGQEFDTSMSQVAATMGMSAAEIADKNSEAAKTFEALSAKAREMGGSTIYSASEAAEGLNILAMSGYDAEQSMNMLEDVLHLAAAGGMEMGNAAAFISGSMKGFNDSSKDSAYYANLMAKGATLANTSVEELGEAMAGGSATAAAYGQSAESMTVALLRLAEQGVAGSNASTALNAAMKDLYTGTDQAKKALKELGVEAYDPVTHEAKDFNQVVNELEASMQGMTDEEKNNYKQTIFGIQGLNAYNKMVVSGTDKQDAWADALAHASDGMGSAAQQYETMTDNLESNIKGWGSAMDEFKLTIYDKMRDPLNDFVKFGTKGLQDITTAFQHGGLSEAMEAVGTVLSEGITKVVELLPTIVTAGSQLLQALVQGIMDNSGILVGTAVDLITQFGTFLVESAPTIGSSITSLLTSIVGFISDNAGSMVDGAFALITGLVDGLVQGLPDLIAEAADLIINFALAITEPANLQSLIQSALSLILALAEGLMQALPKLLEAIPKIVMNLVAALVASAPQLITAAISFISTLRKGLVQALPQIIMYAPTMVASIVKGFLKGVEQFKEVGVQFVAGLWEGIKSNWQSVIEGILGLGQNLIESVKGLFKIQSPSRVMKEIGKYIDEGLANGINDNMGKVDGAFDKLAKYTENPLEMGDFSANINSKSSENARMLGLLEQIANANKNVTIVLEGDTQKLFRAMQRESRRNYELTGQSSFA